MEQRKLLDNMTGQEIKEMIEKKEVVLENLSVLALNRLFDYESDAVCRDDGDGELLCRVADLLAEKEGIADEHDKAFETILENAMQSVIPTEQPKKKHYRLKKALLIAVAVIVLACCASVVVTALGFDVFGYFKDLVFSPAGSKIEESGITLIHNGKTTVYSSIEDLITAEQLEIMYPTKLPDGVSITEVRMVPREDGKETVEIKTTDKNILIYVDLSMENIDNTFADSEKIDKNGTTYYIRKEINTAFTYCLGDFYSIRANDYDQLLKILEYMED